MPSRTQNYNLIKPAQDESYDVDQFNTNFDAIDAQLKANADAANTAQNKANNHSHGNITNDGKIGTIPFKAVYRSQGGDRRTGSQADIHGHISSYICMVIGQHLYGFPI